MKIKLNNDMELVINNENGTGPCIASLVDSDGEIIGADIIDEEMLFEYITSHMSNEQNLWAMKVAELRSLKPGEPIRVYDGQLGYFEAFEPTENGDYTIWFTDDGLYKHEDGKYYDLETHDPVSDYIGNCSLGEYIGRVDKENLLDKAKNIINAYVKAEFDVPTADFRNLRNVNLAFTETEDGKHDIQVDVNLIDFSIIKSVDKSVIEVVQYGSLAELIKNELEGMSFDDLVYLTEGQLAPFYKNSSPKIENIKFCTLIPGPLGNELDSLFEKNNWTLQFWNNDKTTGYQVYFGEGVQVDNLYEYGFSYLYDKDELISFAKDFFIKKIVHEDKAILDEVFSSLGYTDFAERVSELFEEENRFFDYAWAVSKPNQTDPAKKDYIAFWDQGNSWCKIFGVFEGVTQEKFLNELKNIQQQSEQVKPKLESLIESASSHTDKSQFAPDLKNKNQSHER